MVLIILSPKQFAIILINRILAVMTKEKKAQKAKSQKWSKRGGKNLIKNLKVRPTKKITKSIIALFNLRFFKTNRKLKRRSLKY